METYGNPTKPQKAALILPVVPRSRYQDVGQWNGVVGDVDFWARVFGHIFGIQSLGLGLSDGVSRRYLRFRVWGLAVKGF